MRRAPAIPIALATGVAALSLAGIIAAQPAPTWAPRCRLFPPGNVWNRPVGSLPVARNSRRMLTAIGLGAHLHPDFSDQGGYGIPYNVVTRATARYRISFLYASESDKSPYPIPAHPRIEAGSDRHLLVVDRDACRLYELFAARKVGARWTAGSGAIWNLSSNDLRPAGWTSADAAGLPILPGLVRYDEVARGAILHALRFTAPVTRRAFIYPARHEAGSTASAAYPPMGLRIRLKDSVSLRGFSPQVRVILTALKTYGMILADNGSPMYVSGAPDRRWNDDLLHQLTRLTGADFEVVDTGGLRNR